MTCIINPFLSTGIEGHYVGRDANEIHLEFTSDLLSHKPRRMVFPASIPSYRDPKFWQLDLNSSSKKNVVGFHFNLRQADEKIHSIKICWLDSPGWDLAISRSLFQARIQMLLEFHPVKRLLHFLSVEDYYPNKKALSVESRSFYLLLKTRLQMNLTYVSNRVLVKL
ncbi:hypothetical protein TNCT_253671 [Trichonephila clavata]|uniref:Uncharacterized protein n=1 Tax=Trichonephila clavata TaxID=2740835 RepID=A0A8X6HCX3_TRICU|nr:hypothetical protein TNCT_253671 [Trichonephila clavata]